MIFEDILENIGVFGRVQKRLYLAICWRTFCNGITTIIYVFYAGQSDHWCKAPELENVNCTNWSLDGNQCIEAKKSVSIPANEPGSEYDYGNCIRYNITGFEPSDSGLWVPSDFTNDTMDCNAGWVYDTSQFQTTIVTDFDLVCERKFLRNLAQSVFFFGVLIACTFVGAMSDRFGRSTVFAFLVTSGAFFTALTGFSNSYIMFVIIRALIGATYFNSGIVAITHISEFVSPEWRKFVGNMWNFSWAIGYMVAAGMAYFIRQWRTLSFVAAVFPALTIFFIPFLCESPRWLISKGRFKKAEKVIRKVARVNKKKLSDDFFDNLELEGQYNKQEENDHKASVIDLFRFPYLRIKILVLLFIWTVTALVYYGLSLSAGSFGVDYYVSFFISGAIEIPAYLYVMFALDWLGRKPNLSGSLIGGGIACIVALLIKSAIWKTVVATIGKFFITVTFATIYIFTVEQIPTLVRNVGLGLCSTFGRIGSISAPMIFILSDYWQPLPFLLFGVLAIVAGLLALLLPETKGKNLPETIEEGDKFGKFTKLPSKDVEL